MEQRRFHGHHYGYFESQVSHPPVPPHRALPENPDPFLLDLHAACQPHCGPLAPLLAASSAAVRTLLPERLPSSPLTTLTRYDRLSTALTVAQVTGISRLCRHYAAQLAPLSGPDSSRESNVRLAQITQYARQLASQPAQLTPRALSQLIDVGLTPADCVTFHQLIGLVGYQGRTIAVLQALLAMPLPWLPGQSPLADADGPLPEVNRAWQPRLPPLELRYATAGQLAALTDCQPVIDGALAWLLALDAGALSALSQVRAALHDWHRQPHAVLARAVTCRIHGSRHGLAAERHPRRAALRRSVADATLEATPSERAVIEASALLTRSPERFAALHVGALREAGLDDRTLLAVLCSSALAGWEQRLQQPLGD
ncbi:hypothetical protein [Pantoea sp. 1.19]|uniref:CMD domain-containing protein n=1 Tax=Pantoea sp. 1.19 TaxID=1925589 RepID=UPI0009489EFB|nr:hypothetical protein [Pantoea sp. 1.19]